MCGLIRFVTEKHSGLRFACKKVRLPHIMIIFILVLYYFTILFEPIKSWDARSVWFFHAKMIWYAESIGLSAGWLHPSIQFAHPDYPKLVPALAAGLSCATGCWNEYAPKLSLFLILIPPVFWVFSFWSGRLSFLFLVMIFPFGMQSWLWNGYMDGYIALYAAVSMLLAGRYFKHRKPIDLLSGLSCLALISNIKNEGIVIALTGITAILITEITANKFSLNELKKAFSLYRTGWLIFIAAPCVIWSVFYKYQWGMTSNLKMGSREMFLRLLNHFSDGTSLAFILERTLSCRETSILLSLVAFTTGLGLLTALRRHMVSWIPALITAFVYYVSLVLVYLSTPNLEYYLSHSVDRLMLTVSSLIIAGIYFILKELEGTSVSPGKYDDRGIRQEPGRMADIHQ